MTVTFGFFPPKRPIEKEYYGFDFSNILPENVSISAAEWTVTTSRGIDPEPLNLLEGLAQVEGAVSYHMIVGGLNGVRYVLHCRATLSDGQIVELAAPLLVKDVV